MTVKEIREKEPEADVVALLNKGITNCLLISGTDIKIHEL